MKQIALADATKPLSEYATELDQVHDGLVVMSDKKPVALLISLADLDEESFWLSMSPKFMAILEQSRKEFRMGKKSSLDDVKKQIAKWNDEETASTER